MAKSKSLLSKRALKKYRRVLEAVVVMVAVCSIIRPGIIPLSKEQAFLLLAVLGIETGVKPIQGLLKKTPLLSLLS